MSIEINEEKKIVTVKIDELDCNGEEYEAEKIAIISWDGEHSEGIGHNEDGNAVKFDDEGYHVAHEGDEWENALTGQKFEVSHLFLYLYPFQTMEEETEEEMEEETEDEIDEDNEACDDPCEAPTYRGYVKTEAGQYFVQKPDANAKFGFILCDDDQTWDVPPFRSWESVEASEVPQDERERLGWLLEQE